jgi:hypothetical protein
MLLRDYRFRLFDGLQKDAKWDWIGEAERGIISWKRNKELPERVTGRHDARTGSTSTSPLRQSVSFPLETLTFSEGVP